MFNYFGAKHRLAHSYQPPRHDVIVEPFAGAAGYATYWATRLPVDVILVDRNELVIELWARLLSLSPTDIWDYPIPNAGDESSDALIASVASATSSWNALARTGRFQVTEWMARDFPEQRKRIADTRSRINPDRFTLVVGDYTDAPDVDATWFIDPPYQQQGVWYKHNGSGIDFTGLGQWCQSRQGQVIVCEAGVADWLPFEPHRQAGTQVNGTQVELVWYSDPEPSLLDLIDSST